MPHPELSQRAYRRVAGASLVVGGALWSLHALVLNARPEGCIGTQCTTGGGPARPTEDLLWLFAAAVLALGIGLLLSGAVRGPGRADRRVGTSLVLVGVVLLGLGLVVNAALPGDSPLWWLHDSDSLGRFLPVLGSAAAGVGALRGQWFRRWHGAILVLSAVASLGFNAQNARILLVVPLGLTWTLIGLHELRAHTTPRPVDEPSAAGEPMPGP